ncbi:MAG: hypothetical protein Q7S13_06750, partial [Candidatus Omnitrophota bacterium]|nr:hypothetical protein [Candidatus Omnitrophota bacterium]
MTGEGVGSFIMNFKDIKDNIEALGWFKNKLKKYWSWKYWKKWTIFLGIFLIFVWCKVYAIPKYRKYLHNIE